MQCANNLKQISLAMHNHHDARRVFPPGVLLPGDKGSVNAQGSFSNWGLEILPYAEDASLRQLYNPDIPMSDPTQQKVRESEIPIYTCPTDLPQALLFPAGGPDAGNIRYRTDSYRGNAGRTTVSGRQTWYLGEDIAEALIPFTWRGPLHAVVRKESTWTPVDAHGKVLKRLQREPIKNITDGTSKTMLVGESTNITEDIDGNKDFTRRSFWAYSWGPYNLSQACAHPTVEYDWIFYGDYDRCRLAPNNPDKGSQRTCNAAWFSNHVNGMNVQMCDGSGGWVSWDIDLRLFAFMSSIAGGELEATVISMSPFNE
jgi:hypothetical protein